MDEEGVLSLLGLEGYVFEHERGKVRFPASDPVDVFARLTDDDYVALQESIDDFPFSNNYSDLADAIAVAVKSGKLSNSQRASLVNIFSLE